LHFSPLSEADVSGVGRLNVMVSLRKNTPATTVSFSVPSKGEEIKKNEAGEE
jgi:hypothetical protein